MVRDEQTIDLDRVIYDPNYRRWAIEMLNRASADVPATRLSRWMPRVIDELSPATMTHGRNTMAARRTKT
jgi:hypothetical protein